MKGWMSIKMKDQMDPRRHELKSRGESLLLVSVKKYGSGKEKTARRRLSGYVPLSIPLERFAK